jgi:hypothetical protein
MAYSMPSLIRIPHKVFEKKVRFLFLGWWVDLEMIKHVIPLLLLVGLSYSQVGGYALDFDGSDDHVVIPSSIAVANENNFTIEVWAYWRGGAVGLFMQKGIPPQIIQCSL